MATLLRTTVPKMALPNSDVHSGVRRSGCRAPLSPALSRVGALYEAKFKSLLLTDCLTVTDATISSAKLGTLTQSLCNFLKSTWLLRISPWTVMLRES